MAVASFLNVCIDRLPNNESVVCPPSHCPHCRHRLTIEDLIPVASYLRLRGRCRYCGTPIGRRLVLVEIGTGILFAFLYWRYSPTLELAVITYYCCLFTVILFIDLERGIIPNRIVYPGAALALVIAMFSPERQITSAAFGGSVGLGIFLLIVILSRGGMGWGDVKMATLVGFATGFPQVLIALLLTVLSGAAVALVQLLTKRKGRKDTIPFGPFLSLAAMVTLLWGDAILEHYLWLF
jgi:leader peptidase (prepilin peptidase)/N-methyltransferase